MNSLFFEEISEREVINLCSSLCSGTATGFDDVPMSLIKETIISISSPFTHIFNLSINSGMVPIELKIARVVPLFKAGDKSIFSNYRPISVLPSFSKILETLVYNRIIDYLSKYKKLSDNQFGFRKHYSTEYALALIYRFSLFILTGCRISGNKRLCNCPPFCFPGYCLIMSFSSLSN